MKYSALVLFLQNNHILFQGQLKTPESHEKKTCRRKFKYKMNRNMAIGIMKNRIPNLILNRFPEKTLKEITQLQMKFYEPIRPGRSFPRIRKSKKLSGKYQTELNYKRAL